MNFMRKLLSANTLHGNS